MSENGFPEKGKEGKRGGSARRTIRFAGGVLLVLAVVMLVFGFFMARTPGFRSFLEDELTKRTGMQMKVGSARIGWPYALVIENLKSAEDDKLKGELCIRELRVGLRGNLRPKIEIFGCNLMMVRSDLRIWQPVFLAPIGNLQNAEEIDGVVTAALGNVVIGIRDSTVAWADSEGKEMASAGGMDFSMAPARLGERKARYYCLGVRRVRVGEDCLANVRREWLATDERPYIELEHTAGEKAAASGHALWSFPGGSEAGKELR